MGSSPIGVNLWCLSLLGENTGLSSRKSGFESRRHHHMVRSYKWLVHSPFKAVMLGSSPARITNMIRYSSGSRGQSAKLLLAGSNPARISIWSLRLVGQDASLSSWKYGFESRRDHHNLEREPGRSGDRLLSESYPIGIRFEFCALRHMGQSPSGYGSRL